MQKTHEVTQAGLEKLKVDLQKLIDKHEELIKIRGKAMDAGDVSENDELDMVEEAIIANEAEMHELETLIKSAVVVESDNETGVSIGNTVIVDVEGKESTLEVVSERDADPLDGKISLSSPIGKALAGKKPGDTVDVELPKGTVKYTIKQVK